MAYSEFLICKPCSEFQCFLEKIEANGIYVSGTVEIQYERAFLFPATDCYLI